MPLQPLLPASALAANMALDHADRGEDAEVVARRPGRLAERTAEIRAEMRQIKPRDMVDVVPRLRYALETRGWAPRYLEASAAGHDFASWASRVEAMLLFLYGVPSAPHHTSSLPKESHSDRTARPAAVIARPR